MMYFILFFNSTVFYYIIVLYCYIIDQFGQISVNACTVWLKFEKIIFNINYRINIIEKQTMKKIILGSACFVLLQPSNSFLFLPNLFGFGGGILGRSGGSGGSRESGGRHRGGEISGGVEKFNVVTPSALNEQGNFILNGNFNFPQLQISSQIIKSIPGWQSSQVERGIGSVYNSRWGKNIVVLELDGNRNNNLRQTISLTPGKYSLSFRWAARSGNVNSSGMTILWNQQKIFSVMARDEEIYSERIPLTVTKSGNYVLQIQGDGNSDSFGLTLANLRLTLDSKIQPRPIPIPMPEPEPEPQTIFVKPRPQPRPKPEPVPQPVDQQVDNQDSTPFTLVSGDKFSTTSSKYFQMWQMRGFSIVSGKKFNSEWGADVNSLVSSLDSTGAIKQKAYLNGGKYTFQFDHIAKKGSTKPQKFLVFLNDKQIGTASPIPSKVKTFSASFNVSKPGNFRFEIRVQKCAGCQQISLSNPRLSIKTDMQQSSQTSGSESKTTTTTTTTKTTKGQTTTNTGISTKINKPSEGSKTVKTTTKKVTDSQKPSIEFPGQQINWDDNTDQEWEQFDNQDEQTQTDDQQSQWQTETNQQFDPNLNKILNIRPESAISKTTVTTNVKVQSVPTISTINNNKRKEVFTGSALQDNEEPEFQIQSEGKDYDKNRL